MKNYFLISAFLLGFVAAEAQVQINDSGNHSLMLITTKKNEALNKVEGSPFLNDKFLYGKAVVEGKEPLNVFVRYDVSTEQMEIKTDPASEEIYVLPPGQHAVYKVGQDVFLYDRINFEGKNIEGYFVEHFAGDDYRLLEKHRVEISEAVKAKTGYDRDKPARIKVEQDLFVVKDDGSVWKVRARNKDLKDIFTSPEARNYLSDNKVKSTQDLVNFVAFLDKQAD